MLLEGVGALGLCKLVPWMPLVLVVVDVDVVVVVVVGGTGIVVVVVVDEGLLVVRCDFEEENRIVQSGVW